MIQGIYLYGENKMTANTLILLGGMDWLEKSMQASGLVDVASVYKSRNKLTKPLFKLQYHTKLLYRYRHVWYDDWKNKLNQYRTVILFDAFEDTDIIEYIQGRFSKIRIIIYYYNPIYNSSLLNRIISAGVEVWSFDIRDCKEYGLMYNPQFYFWNIVFPEKKSKDIKAKSIAYDLIFIGKDKGRMPLLMKLNKYLKERGISLFIGICPDKETRYSSECKQFFIKSIPYNNYLDYLKRSRCVLDIVQEGQVGLTLRIMEALFYNKKIITNNRSIQDMKIYDKNNVYILGIDNRDLVEFIKDSKCEWDEELKKQYIFDKWLHRFFDIQYDIKGL